MNMAEDDLPQVLEKLEIDSTPPIIKLMDNLSPVNPFFDNGNISTQSYNSTQKELFGISRNLSDFRLITQNSRQYNIRRLSESIVDEFVSKPRNSINVLQFAPILRSSLKIQKNNLKKNGWSGGRKVIIREPILRALQSCFDIQTAAIQYTTLANFDNELTCTKEKLIFRDLINECQTVLQERVKFDGSINNLSTRCKISKQYKSMQASKLTKKSFIAVTNKRPQVDNGISSRVNTSCSQQAATHHPCINFPSYSNCRGSSVTDDVTIDELASYFDALVHIPKKMSSMAEMMYI